MLERRFDDAKPESKEKLLVVLGGPQRAAFPGPAVCVFESTKFSKLGGSFSQIIGFSDCGRRCGIWLGAFRNVSEKRQLSSLRC